MSAVAHDNSDKNMEKLSIPPGEISPVTLSQAISLRVQVSGQSMYPLIQPGDTILIKAVDADNLTPGDIALYYLPSGIFLIHRVIKKSSSGSLLTNGDSLRQPDEPIAGEQVFGRVVEIERNGRVINLTGTLNVISARLVTFLARHRLPLQIHMKQALGRLQWFLGGKIKA